MRPAYIGIDLAIAKGKFLPVVVCTWDDGRFVPQPLRQLELVPPQGMGNAATLNHAVVGRFVGEARTYVTRTCQQLALVPTRIGIDAPSAPRRSELARRHAEVALDRAGISCFTTPSKTEFDAICDKVARHLADGGREDRIPHANQLWMRVGFALFVELSELAPCIEVFPQAIARAIEAGDVHKSRVGAAVAQLAVAARYTGWPTLQSDSSLDTIAWGAAHDQVDAYLSAWIAGLEENDRAPLGAPPDDVIWVPKVSASFQVPQVPRAARPPTDAAPSGVSLLCPGCGEKQFQRWPWGWDAHAAHACRGLTETEPERRKAEFRRRFEQYFKR